MKIVTSFGFDREYASTLAIYCSDGRFAEACDWFIEHHLGIPKFDQMAVPGGPAWLSLDIDRVWEHEIARRHVGYLIRAHRIEQVILIAHENCGFYRERRVPEEKMKERQVADLQSAVQYLLRTFPNLKVQSYYVRGLPDGVDFEAVVR
jgi:hypothetical protein